MIDTLANKLAKINGGSYLSLFLFLFTILGIIYLASKVEKAADTLTAKTKLGASFVGGLLLAIISSVPEFVTEISQATSGRPNVAASSELGSNAFSIFMIFTAAFILLFKNVRYLKESGRGPLVILIQGTIMAALVLIGTLYGDVHIGPKGGYGIGIIPVLIFTMFIISNIVSYKMGLHEITKPEKRKKEWSLRTGIIVFIISGLGISLFAILLNISAIGMQIGFNLNDNSIGGIFLAIATSSTEVIMFVVLILNKQYIMSMATIVGSHTFNLGLILFGDLAYTKGSYFNSDTFVENKVWPLAILTLVTSSLLIISILISTKLKNKWWKLPLYTIGISSYIVFSILTMTQFIENL